MIRLTINPNHAKILSVVQVSIENNFVTSCLFENYVFMNKIVRTCPMGFILIDFHGNVIIIR